MFRKQKNYPIIAFLISGKGSNMDAILKKIEDKKLKVQVGLVFSDKPKAPGLLLAKKRGYSTATFSPSDFESREIYEQYLTNTLIKKNVQWVICAGYMRILHKPILKAFPNKIINIHPSLLPSFPGLSAQKQALKYGVKYTGCTIHFVDEGIDTGKIIAQKIVPILPKDTEKTLSLRILKEEHNLYWKVIKDLIK